MLRNGSPRAALGGGGGGMETKERKNERNKEKKEKRVHPGIERIKGVKLGEPMEVGVHGGDLQP